MRRDYYVDHAPFVTLSLDHLQTGRGRESRVEVGSGQRTDPSLLSASEPQSSPSESTPSNTIRIKRREPFSRILVPSHTHALPSFQAGRPCRSTRRSSPRSPPPPPPQQQQQHQQHRSPPNSLLSQASLTPAPCPRPCFPCSVDWVDSGVGEEQDPWAGWRASCPSSSGSRVPSEASSASR